MLWEVQAGPRKLLAWCLTDGTDVGYGHVAYTTMEGDPVDAPVDPRFTRVLATMPGPTSPHEPTEVLTDEFLVPRGMDLIGAHKLARDRCSTHPDLDYTISIDRRRRRWPFRHDVVIATWTHAALRELPGTTP